MNISLNIADILNDIRANVSMETSGLSDVDARKRIDVASKTVMLKRHLSSASTELTLSLHRFLRCGVTDLTDDDIVEGESLGYEVIGGARRLDGKEKAIALRAHECLVELSLQRFFTAVGLLDYAKIHASQSALVLQGLESLLRQKGAPKIVEP